MTVAATPPPVSTSSAPRAGLKGARAWFEAHKVEAGAAGVGLVAAYALWRKSHNAAAVATGANAASGQPAGTTAGTSPVASALPTTPSDDWNTMGEIEQALQALETQISGLTTVTPASTTDPTSTSTTSGNTTSPAPSPAPSLPWIGPGSLPTIIKPGQYSPNEFEVVGQETNGVYSGEQVAGGVPLFGTAFGGLFQNFGLPGGPSPKYTGPVYAPTADQQYVDFTGTITGAPS